MFNDIIVQEEAMPIVRELGVSYRAYEQGTYVMDSVHTTSALIYQATESRSDALQLLYRRGCRI